MSAFFCLKKTSIAWTKDSIHHSLCPMKVLIQLIIFSLFISCEKSPEIYTIHGKTMGTTYMVKFVTNESPELDVIREKIDTKLDKINMLMSTYINDSELQKFNTSQDHNWFKISNETLLVIKKAIEVSKQTDGEYDITAGPLINLWGFGPNKKPIKVPSLQEITETKSKIGFDKININEENSSINKTTDIFVDLSSLAKGYGVDEISRVMKDLNFPNHLVEIGGEMKASGTKPNNKKWTVAIEKPLAGTRKISRPVELENMSIATSGDYRNFFEFDGKRFSHIISPKTGKPIEHNLASVTVIMDDCMSADAWATAFLVLGAKKAVEIANKIGIAAYLIVKNKDNFETITTKQFDLLLGESN